MQWEYDTKICDGNIAQKHENCTEIGNENIAQKSAVGMLYRSM